MINCAQCNEQLSAYLDGIMTAEEKNLLEEHLSTCERCSLALSELKKTQETLRNLEEVEPPPWFTQKIINRVREEAESRKGLLQRLFYPFHLKIPMEALATCLIVVLALFVYKNTGPEMKTIHEPEEIVAPQGRVERHDGKTLSPAGETGSQSATLLKKDSPEEQKSKEAPAPSPSTDTSGLIKDIPPPPPAATPKSRVAKKDLEETESSYEARRAFTKQEPVPEQKIAAAPAQKPAAGAPPAKLKEEKIPTPAGSTTTETQGSISFRSSSPKSKAFPVTEKRQFLFTVFTNTFETTVKETENLLRHFGAKNIARTSRQPDSVRFDADLPGRKIKEFSNALKTMGSVKEKEAPDNREQEYIAISIEITSNP